MFNTKNNNATDGETVYLSPNINKRRDFDTAVGLALHEGSHIVYSDFVILKTLWQRTPRELYDVGIRKNIDKSRIVKLVKTMLNYVEDRYIDSLVYSSAPGYRGYYISLYDAYFNVKSNEKVLKSKTYRFPSFDAYEFRIINFTNVGTDLDALPDLRKIYELIDIPTVLRLKRTDDRLNVAIDVCKLILKNIGKQSTENNSGTGNNPVSSPDSSKSETVSDENQDSEESDVVENEQTGSTSQPIEADAGDEKGDENNDAIGGNDVDTEVEPAEKPSSSCPTDEDTGKGDVSDLTESELKELEKNFNRQRRFVGGDVKKGILTPKQSASVDAIEKSGMVLVRVGKELSDKPDFRGIECVVVNKLTNELIEDPEFPLSRGIQLSLGQRDESSVAKAVRDGVVKGRMLGRRLQLRDDVKVTKYMRQPTGKIDRRLISELGYDVANVFYTSQTDKFSDVFLHISVDASLSMSGTKWVRAITTVVAICKAASMISNIRVSVSFRTTVPSVFAGDSPYVVMAYDSKSDSFNKIVSQFKHLMPNNGTPEGLAFEAIMEHLPPKTFGEDRYFLNLSDGQPCFLYSSRESLRAANVEYIGDVGSEHTRKQVNKIRGMGYKILSYFIEQPNVESTDVQRVDFKRMYGKSASFIDVDNVVKIANTLNAMFLEKSE
jgi:nitric oxide reductase activation protein